MDRAVREGDQSCTILRLKHLKKKHIGDTHTHTSTHYNSALQRLIKRSNEVKMKVVEKEDVGRGGRLLMKGSGSSVGLLSAQCCRRLLNRLT